jgi:NAD(P)-dependent dehydrogenase (short-subunit alcohol dehydrogenase family)
MARSSYPVRDKVVLVTGAARGIGAEAARQLARRGAHVSLVGLEPEELERVATDCGPEAVWFEADVTDRDAIGRAASGTVERFGAIDVAIANAGIGGGSLVRYSDPEAFERTIEVNLLGSYRTLDACIPYLIERRGYWLQVASLAAFGHAPGMGAYAASKAGVEALADCLRAEVAHLGVDVGVAYFSWIGTDLVTAGRDSNEAFSKLREQMRGPMAKTYPVSDAGEAIVRGIESRSRAITVPGWIKAVMLFRGLISLFGDRPVRDVMPEVDEAVRRDVEARGVAEASAPAGPGGEAATRAAAERRERDTSAA